MKESEMENQHSHAQIGIHEKVRLPTMRSVCLNCCTQRRKVAPAISHRCLLRPGEQCKNILPLMQAARKATRQMLSLRVYNISPQLSHAGEFKSHVLCLRVWAL